VASHSSLDDACHLTEIRRAKRQPTAADIVCISRIHLVLLYLHVYCVVWHLRGRIQHRSIPLSWLLYVCSHAARALHNVDRTSDDTGSMRVALLVGNKTATTVECFLAICRAFVQQTFFCIVPTPYWRARARGPIRECVGQPLTCVVNQVASHRASRTWSGVEARGRVMT
jgi:hypothetical protein